MYLKEIESESGLDATGSRYGLMTGYCKSSDFVKDKEFHTLRD
jgi:hypothetical protein